MFFSKIHASWEDSLTTYAKFTEKLTFQPWPDQGVRNNFSCKFCVRNKWMIASCLDRFSRSYYFVSLHHTFFSGTGSDLLISMLEKVNWFRLTGLITGSIDVKMDGSVLEEISSFKMLGVAFLFLNRIGNRALSLLLELLLKKSQPWFFWNVASLSLFYRYYFGRCSSELAQLVSLPYSRGRATCYSGRLHDFSVTIPRCYKAVYVSFLAQLDFRIIFL